MSADSPRSATPWFATPEAAPGQMLSSDWLPLSGVANHIAVLSLIGGLVWLYFASKRWSAERDERVAEAEALALLSSPREFTADEYVPCRMLEPPRHTPGAARLARSGDRVACAFELRLRALAHRLLVYDGSSAKHPLLLALKGRVLDVRKGDDYYGPGGPYCQLAGRDGRSVDPLTPHMLAHVCGRVTHSTNYNTAQLHRTAYMQCVHMLARRFVSRVAKGLTMSPVCRPYAALRLWRCVPRAAKRLR